MYGARVGCLATTASSKAVEAWAFYRGVALDFTRPGKSTDNRHIESCNGRLRDEGLNAHQFLSIEHAQRLIEAWRIDYDQQRPSVAADVRRPRQLAVVMIGFHGVAPEAATSRRLLDNVKSNSHLERTRYLRYSSRPPLP